MKRYLHYGSMFILSVMLLGIIVGCSDKLQPKAWLSVEKAPMRVIIVDNEKDITPATINMVIRQVHQTSYKDYQFNPTTAVSVTADYSAEKQDHSSSKLEVN